MAKVTAFGQPVNDAERDAIAYLRAHLPDDYEIFHNLEIKQNKEVFEIDLVILAPHCVFVVDIKGIHGRIEVCGSKWHPEDRQPYYSPVAKLRQHAKALSSIISDANRANSDLRLVHIQAAVLITADDVHLVDYDGRDESYVTYCNQKCLNYFQSSKFIPDRRLKEIGRFLITIKRVIQGKASPKSAVLRYRDWQVEEKLGGNKRYTEYRAKKIFMDGWTFRLRVYKVDPYLEKGEREAQQKLISNAFQAVLKIPPHINILGVRDFFATDDSDCLVLVTDDIPGQALRQYVKKQNLSLEQKLAIIEQVLIALAHAHKYGVIHRNITPDNILVGTDGQVRLIGFDYARIGNRTSTIADDIIDELEDDAVYQAVECYRDPSKASVTSDLFSAGLVFYELLTGQQAFESMEKICDRAAIFPVKPSQLQPDIPSNIDSWLQKFCAFTPEERFCDADNALQELKATATLPSIDLSNLPVDSYIDERYRVLKRLGHPGSFAVAYQVFDTLGEQILVLKLVTRDRRSVYTRLRQEYKTLKQVPEHPHVVKVIWAGELKDGTPFITFEYVEGENIEHLIAARQISLEQAVEITKEIAQGLAHLHQHGVYHQDIKPSNLFLTKSGVRIIDFNIAVSDRDEETISAGTRRYLPPDYKVTLNFNTEEKIDRDLYALGITFYECVTGCYPFDEPQPPIGKLLENPCEINGCEDLSERLVQLLMKAIAPKRAERFASATEFLEALTSLSSIRKSLETSKCIEQLPPLESNEGEIEAKNKKITTLQTSETIAENIESPVQVLPPITSTSELPQPQSTTEPVQPVTPQTQKVPCNLFDSTSTINQTQVNADKPIVLDPTGLYEIPSGYIPITTEVEWIKFFGVSKSPCWVKGKRLCTWADEWLRVWNRTEMIAEKKQDPRTKLTDLFQPVTLPSAWTDKQLLTLATKLDSYPQDNPIAYLLAEITGSDQLIWVAKPSINNLAAWLAIQVPEEYRPLEQVWQQQCKQHHLASYYHTEDKLWLLKRWLGIASPPLTELGKYPLTIPDFLTTEFDLYWEQQIYRTEGKAVDNLIPNSQSGIERIAAQAYKVLINRPNLINKVRETKVAAYLTHQQKVELSDLQPPPQPQPLALDASPQQALTWVTESYLPFRRWEVFISQRGYQQRISDKLADTFVEWMLQHYPELKIAPVNSSYLNYSSTSLVQNLCQQGPVFWVVVDGLSWLDHIEILSFLTKNQKLAVETYIQPRFSILPTKTEYAKWSLYSQLLPIDSSWTADVEKGFSMIGMGKRYTDHRKAALRQDLKNGQDKLYCWDTTQIDDLYHTERDWEHLYKVQRPHVLEGIAKEIQSFVDEYPDPEQLRVVISSDHGQIIGESLSITNYPNQLEPKGRIAKGITDDPRFVVLEGNRYGLPHDISIVRGSATLGSFSYTTNKQIIGSHGGIFPEEVVVGVSVLRKSVPRLPVLVSCQGEGRPRERGEIELIVDNPNSVPLTDLCLYIQELPCLRAGKVLEETISANSKVSFKIQIPEWPELPPHSEGNRLSVSGELTFRFASANQTSAILSTESVIIVNQIFSSGFNIDEFF